MKTVAILFAIVTMSIRCAAGPIISVDPNTFDFTAEVGGANPDDKTLTITNIGVGTLDWTISESCGWLTVTPDSGSSADANDITEVTLSVDITGLAWGNYNCQLTVSDPCAMNSPQIVSVNLDIIGPIIELSDTSFNFFAEEGGINPDDQFFTIRNVGPGTLNWLITEDCSWLTVTPDSGTSTGEADAVILSVDITGLTDGLYTCDLTITDPCAMNSPQTVNVNLGIGADVPYQYPTIQEAIDAAINGDTIIVAPGTYYENINFNGKNIVLTSIDPSDPVIVAATIIDGGGSGSVVTFSGTEISACQLTGFTITNGIFDSGGGIVGGTWDNETHATISNCVITGNSAFVYGGGLFNCHGLITNCIITNNRAGLGGHGGGLAHCDGIISNCVISYNKSFEAGFDFGDGGGLAHCDGIIENCLITENWAEGGGGGLHGGNGTITNCTITGNAARSGGGLYGCYGSIINSIIWGNSASQDDQLHQSSAPTYSCIQNWGSGGSNISDNPLFFDTAADDYHLKSEAGRWDPCSETRVTDTVTSPCIDAGEPIGYWDPNSTPADPNDDFWVWIYSVAGISEELWPDGGRINMGAYGGTAQASMSVDPVGNAADFNKDDFVDYEDFSWFFDSWQREEILLAEDINRNNFVDMVDLALFAQEWLWEQPFN